MLMCMLLHWFYFIIDLTQLPVALSSFSSTGLDENQGGTVISTFIVSACLFLWSAALSRPPPVSFSPPPPSFTPCVVPRSQKLRSSLLRNQTYESFSRRKPAVGQSIARCTLHPARKSVHPFPQLPFKHKVNCDINSHLDFNF